MYLFGIVRDEFIAINPFSSELPPMMIYMSKIEEYDRDTLLFSKLRLKGLDENTMQLLIKQEKEC